MLRPGRQVNICHETSAWVHDVGARRSRVAVARAAEKAVKCGWRVGRWGATGGDGICVEPLAGPKQAPQSGWTWRGKAQGFIQRTGFATRHWVPAGPLHTIGPRSLGYPLEPGLPVSDTRRPRAGCGTRTYRLSAAKPAVRRARFTSRICFNGICASACPLVVPPDVRTERVEAALGDARGRVDQLTAPSSGSGQLC